MKLRLLLTTALLSVTVLNAAGIDGDGAAVAHNMGQSYIGVRHELDAYVIIDGTISFRVYPNSVIRSEIDYTVCATDNSLSHAFRPNSPEVWQKWLNGIKFLLETINAGVEYATSLNEERDFSNEQSLPRSITYSFLVNLLAAGVKILSTLKFSWEYAFLEEFKLNFLYQNIMISIDEIQEDATASSKLLVEKIYIPIRDWLKENFPVNEMYQFLQPKVGPVLGDHPLVQYSLDIEKYLRCEEQ